MLEHRQYWLMRGTAEGFCKQRDQHVQTGKGVWWAQESTWSLGKLEFGSKSVRTEGGRRRGPCRTRRGSWLSLVAW